MSAEACFDTNVLVCAFAQDDPRAEVAQRLLARGGSVSVQALSEFAVVARRKLRMSWTETGDALAAIRELCRNVIAVDAAVHERALAIAQRRDCNIYDALMIAAAMQAGCDVLYTDDMQDGQVFRSGTARLTLSNPFA